MIHFKEYRRPLNLEEAFELNQKKSAVIAGGFCFLRLKNKNYQTLIDLSGLVSDRIEELPEEFRIGAMTPLRELEKHEALNRYMGGTAGKCVGRIVGTQFRSCATVGGSIFGRYGFSDVLTCFLAADSYAELFKRGRVPLSQFAKEPADGDLLLALIVKKKPIMMAYEAMRQEAADFPILTVAVSEDGSDKTRIVVGARPARAAAAEYDGRLSSLTKEELNREAKQLSDSFTYGGNMRGSAEYRKYLAGVLIARAAVSVKEMRQAIQGETR